MKRVVRAGIRSLVTAGVLLAMTGAANALPVIPGIVGYGVNTTTAGRGGTVYRVTNINASGAGSLKACLDATGPRTCIFEVSGVIRLTDDLKIRTGDITIAGQTAPSPGIMIRGGGLKVDASNVLIQHIRFRVGDDPVGPDPGNRDNLKIEGNAAGAPVTNVIIDHCSFSWSIDELASVWGPHDMITFTNNIFSEPLNDSIHPTDDGTGLEKHGFGVLLGSSETGGRVTMIGNLFAHSVERNPLARSRELVFVNNLVYDRMNIDLDVQSQDGRLQKMSVVGNEWIKGPSNVRTTKPMILRTGGSYPLYTGSSIYVEKNYSMDLGTSPTQYIGYSSGDIIANLVSTTTRPVWHSGLVVLDTANNVAYESVLKNAGARPTDRDAADLRAVSDVRNRAGQIINCVAADGSARCAKNAGGWPTLKVNTRALSLPANQASMTSTGYSNLELWLQQMDKTVSGVVQSSSPAAPQKFTVK